VALHNDGLDNGGANNQETCNNLPPLLEIYCRQNICQGVMFSAKHVRKANNKRFHSKCIGTFRMIAILRQNHGAGELTHGIK